MAASNLLEDLDELEGPQVKSVGFKKKAVKGKNFRSKALEWEQSVGQTEEPGIEDPLVSNSSSDEHKAGSSQSHIDQSGDSTVSLVNDKTVDDNSVSLKAGESIRHQPSSNPNKAILDKWKRKIQDDEKDAASVFAEDQEFIPVVHNLDELDGETLSGIPNMRSIRNDASVGLEEPKYVPKLDDKESVFKVTEKELREEYEDKHNYDDGSNERKMDIKLDLDADDDMLVDESDAGELKIGPSKRAFEINKDMYDLEIKESSDENDDEDIPEDLVGSTRRKTDQDLQLHEPLSIREQIVFVKDLVTQLCQAKLTGEREREAQQAELERIKQKKQSLLQELEL